MKKGVRAFIIVAVLVICVGFGIYIGITRRPAVIPEKPPPPPPRAEVPAEAVKVKVYRVAIEDNLPVLRAVETVVPAGEDPVEFALRCLIEQGDKADLANPIPEGSRLLGLKIEGNLATVDLSREFRDNFAGGSEAEGLTIGAILRTLGQFPTVKRVQLLVEGRPLETLGHLELSGPQDVTWVGTQFGGGN